MTCCNNGLADVFTEAASRKDADRYRRKGLPARARKLLAAVGALKDRTTLEIGVGAGGVTVEMLRRGAAHAVGVDAIPGQLQAARRLATEFGVVDRADFVLGDFTERDVDNADVVVLDRVICCYPEWRALLTSAASRAQMTVAMTYPRDVAFMRFATAAMNVFWKLRRSAFRFHVHPIDEMHALLKMHGFRLDVPSAHLGWEILVARRERVG